jgi:hypothetical protein
MALDGVDGGSASPEALAFAELAAHSNCPGSLSGAAWRVLTANASHSAFGKSAGAWLSGTYGNTAALYSASHPAHTGTLGLFLQSDLTKVLNRSLAAYALGGLLRTNTPASRDLALAFVNTEGDGRKHVEKALEHLANHADDAVDPSVLPGFFAVMATLDNPRRGKLGAAMEKAIARVNGLGMTPARRARLRRDLLADLRDQGADPLWQRQYAMMTLQLVGTIDDVEEIEKYGRSVPTLEQTVRTIKNRTPEIALPGFGPRRE